MGARACDLAELLVGVLLSPAFRRCSDARGGSFSAQPMLAQRWQQRGTWGGAAALQRRPDNKGSGDALEGFGRRLLLRGGCKIDRWQCQAEAGELGGKGDGFE
jgi:hypothetical protein